MKFGTKLTINRAELGNVSATVIGMKRDKIKVKCDQYKDSDKLDVEFYGGIWIRKSQIVNGDN